mmetsp:Transcript_28831/g.64457  ORF Transcript_28831/g.64457 Transcript_28831/m.64457 type:complete len:308 (-) Transcript_28831:123-1046(-)
MKAYLFAVSVVAFSGGVEADAEQPAAAKTPWSIQPYFKFPRISWPSIAPLLKRFGQEAESSGKGEKGGPLSHSSWSVITPKSLDEEIQLHWRGFYEDWESMHKHQDALIGLIDDILLADQALATLQRVEITGPKEDVEKEKKLDPSLSLKADYYESEDGFWAKFQDPTADRSKSCSTDVKFKVQNWTRARSVIKKAVEDTAKEPGCFYSGWSMKHNDLYLRESYTDGEAVNSHFKNVAPLFDLLIAPDVATLETVEVHGPKEELEKTKDITALINAPFTPVFYAITSGGDEEPIALLSAAKGTENEL